MSGDFTAKQLMFDNPFRLILTLSFGVLTVRPLLYHETDTVAPSPADILFFMSVK